MSSQSDILLSDYKPRPSLVTADNTPARAKFPAVDAHCHLGQWKKQGAIHLQASDGHWSMQDIPASLALLDELNIHCSVDLDGGWGDDLKRHLERHKQAYPSRFEVFTWVDWSEITRPGFGEKWAKHLEDAVKAGASGLKVFKELGLKYRDSAGKVVMPDDPRLDPVWARAGELGIPVLIHTADPVTFFEPLDATNERWEELAANPDWHFHNKGLPGFMELIESREVWLRAVGLFIIGSMKLEIHIDQVYGCLKSPDEVVRNTAEWARTQLAQ